jgi:hypothetical protein
MIGVYLSLTITVIYKLLASAGTLKPTAGFVAVAKVWREMVLKKFPFSSLEITYASTISS